MGIKSDLEAIRKVNKIEAEQWAQSIQSIYIEASSYTCTNVDLVFFTFLTEAYCDLVKDLREGKKTSNLN